MDGVDNDEIESMEAIEETDVENCAINMEPDLEDMGISGDDFTEGMDEPGYLDNLDEPVDTGDTGLLDHIVDKGLETLGVVADHAIETVGEVAKEAITNTIEDFMKK